MLHFLLHDHPESFSVQVHDVDGGIVLQVFAKLGNKYVHAAGCKIIIVAPNVLERFGSRKQIILKKAKQL